MGPGFLHPGNRAVLDLYLFARLGFNGARVFTPGK